MKIELPHIKFIVEFKDLSELQGVEIKGSAFTAKTDGGAVVFIENISETVKDVSLTPWIAHELVHVLQIICEHINADFRYENEHMAYIMHYLMSELLKYKA